MDITASNNEIHKLNLLLLLAMKMIKNIDCMRKKIHIHIIIIELMRYVVILVKRGKIPKCCAKGQRTEILGFFCGGKSTYITGLFWRICSLVMILLEQ